MRFHHLDHLPAALAFAAASIVHTAAAPSSVALELILDDYFWIPLLLIASGADHCVHDGAGTHGNNERCTVRANRGLYATATGVPCRSILGPHHDQRHALQRQQCAYKRAYDGRGFIHLVLGQLCYHSGWTICASASQVVIPPPPPLLQPPPPSPSLPPPSLAPIRHIRRHQREATGSSSWEVRTARL